VCCKDMQRSWGQCLHVVGEGSNIGEDVLRSRSQCLLVVGEGSSDVGQASQVDPAQGESAELLTGARPFAQLPQELPGRQQPGILLTVYSSICA